MCVTACVEDDFHEWFFPSTPGSRSQAFVASIFVPFAGFFFFI